MMTVAHILITLAFLAIGALAVASIVRDLRRPLRVYRERTAYDPPEHFNCRCQIIPAIDDGADHG